jgi:uncharacterized membrane protein YraQ (UPF0718 family)
LPAGVAYLLAAPTLNPLCLVSTFLAFRFASPWHMVGLRAAGAIVLAVSVGLLAARVPLSRLLKGEVLLQTGPAEGVAAWMDVAPKLRGQPRRWGVAFGLALTDFLNVSTLYVLGALLSALLQTLLPLGAILAAHKTLSIPAALLLAFLFSLCSSADAFVVVAFGALGLGGQMAFLWLGPIYSLRTVFVYRDLFQYRAILGLGLAIVLLIGLLASLVGK